MYYIDYEVYPDDIDVDYNVTTQLQYSVYINNIFYDENHISDVFYNTDDPPKVGDDVFLVYAVYSSGDSYEVEDGKNFYPVCITKNKDYAEKIRTILDQSDADGVDVKSIVIPLENGGTVTIDTPWNDYFGYLNKVDIIELTVKKG